MDVRTQPSAETLRFNRDGAELFARAVDASDLTTLEEALSDYPADAGGIRLFGAERLRPLLRPHGAIGALANALTPRRAKAVRAILFDKTPAANWSLGWHQDRVIAVRERVEVEGFGPWTRKHGALHVEPPFDILAAMVTLRVHLDPVPSTNAPLLIAPGSHRLGRILEHEIKTVVAYSGVAVCLAEPGDIWAYATPILHASERAAEPAHRRALQIDFAHDALPGDLRWLRV